jgi:cell division protein FtsI/penicillin-binding protein 2
MTLRGRASIAAAAMAVGLGVVWLADRSFSRDLPADLAVTVPPDVAASPVELASAPPPQMVAERLPVSRRALELRVVDVSGVDQGLASQSDAHGRLYETVSAAGSGPVRIEYTLDAELTRAVFRTLERGRVKFGNVVLLDPATGRVLAYTSTNADKFPPTRNYPAASLVKVITAAAALDVAPEKANLPCRFRGSPYRLTPSRIDPPRAGNTVSLGRALATSNNQCFAQLAVHAVGYNALMTAISRFGWLEPPAPAHAAGSADPGDDRFAFGKLGCGLSGCRITPLHAAQLAATLAHGELVAPRWIESIVDSRGRELPLADSVAPRRVVSPKLAAELRGMLVETTRSGTARRAFRKRNGTPMLGPVKVAGKTGSLTGKNPGGRYEWFIGTAPADEPRIAIAVVMVQGDLYWRTASQVAASVLRTVFCPNGVCSADAADRWTHPPAGDAIASLSRAELRID